MSNFVTPSTSNKCVASAILKNYRGKVQTNSREIIYAEDALSGLSSRTYSSKIYTSSGVESSSGFTPYYNFYGGRWVYTVVATDRAGNQTTGTFTINVTYEN